VQVGQKERTIAAVYIQALVRAEVFQPAYLRSQAGWASVPSGRISNSPTTQSPIVGGKQIQIFGKLYTFLVTYSVMIKALLNSLYNQHKMSKHIIFSCLLLFYSFLTTGQGVSNEIPIFGGNANGTICKGDTAIITILQACHDYNYPNFPNNILIHNRVFSIGATMCFPNTNSPYNVSESQPIVTGEGVISVVNTFSGSPCNPAYTTITIKAKPSNTASYNVHWQVRHTIYDGIGGQPNGSYTDYKYNGNFNITVISVTKPIIKANRALVLPTEQATLDATGGNATNGYQWKSGCAGSTWNSRTNPIQVGPGTYKVRLVQNGCIGDSSDPIVILPETASPVALGCNNAEAQNIYLFTHAGNDGRMDYHQYNVETVICNTGASNPDCTLENVWRKLKSNAWNNAPLMEDFKPATGTNLPVIFSDVLCRAPGTTIPNCTNLSLPGLSSNHITFIALSKVCGFNSSFRMYINSLINDQIANPIVQTIDESTHSITNYTLPGHMLYPGRIIRTVVSECGVIKIKTIGVGRSWVGDNICGKTMAEINSYVGKQTFSNIDQRFKNSN
jgi:hypothetical protein